MRVSLRKVLPNTGKITEISRKAVIYQVAGVQVDPARAEVRCQGEAIALRPKTFRVLLFLLERPDRVVTKDELIAGVWQGMAVSDDVIFHSVAELRKALGDDLKNPHIIKTFPKLGYGLKAPVEILDTPPLETEKGKFRLPSWRWLAAVVFVIGVVSAFAVFYHRPAPNLSEVAWWKLDEGRGRVAADASGNGQSGSIGDDVTWKDGRRGKVLWLGGPASSVTGRGRNFLPAGSSPRTITAWFRVASPRVDNNPIFDYGSELRGPSAEHFTLMITADAHIRLGTDSYHGNITGAGRWDDDRWHMVAAAYDGPATNGARIFVDGKLDRAERMSAVPKTGRDAGWRIGQLLIGGSAFRGEVDDVRVYSRALDATRITALYRCSADVKDLRDYYYLPVYYPGLALADQRDPDTSTEAWNTGNDYTGIQLARSDGDCAISGLRGATVAQDLRMSVDLLVPGGSAGHIAEAGPYFRSRRAAPGDGLIGGTSAGYWVMLLSTGMVKVKRLNPQAVVAFSLPAAGFDSSVYHHLEAEASGDRLQVWLDGKAVIFDQWGKQVDRVWIPSAWEGPPSLGHNDGAAGIAFGAEHNRGFAGGQRARNFSITPAAHDSRTSN